MTTRKGQQVPALVEEFQCVGRNDFLVALVAKTLVGDQQATVCLNGLNDGLQVFFTSGHVLQQDSFSEADTVGEHSADGQRGEHPSLDAFIVEHLRIGDVVFVATIEVTFYDDTKHVEDSILVADERGTSERTAAYHLVFHSQITDLFERESFILAQSIDEPDVLLENLCWFHVDDLYLLAKIMIIDENGSYMGEFYTLFNILFCFGTNMEATSNSPIFQYKTRL